MFQISFDFGGIEEFDVCLQDPELHARAQASRSVLIQFLTSSRMLRSAAALYAPIVQRFPGAVVTGVTTAGEIAKGEFLRSRIVVIFSFFDTSELQLFSLGCSRGEEEESGRRLAALLQEEARESELKGILLYATTQRMDGAGLLRGMRGLLPDVPVFGAGAASYEYDTESSLVLAGEQLYRDGAAAVVFRGKELKIQARDYLGWEPLSRDMTVTETGGPTWIKTLDGVPAAEVYEKYLGIRNDEHFFKNMLEFPLMIKRADQILARVPVARGQEGSLHLAADVHEGEQVRLAYGNPKHIVITPDHIRQQLDEFRPQGILLFSCYSRQIYLQDAVNLETGAFQQFAPSAGLYTYGEFYGRGDNVQLHNASMVAVAMREGEPPREQPAPRREEPAAAPGTKQMELTSRLAKFIGVVVEELEQANREMQALMQTDRLTGLHNRGKMEDLLNSAMRCMESGRASISIILLDIDRFKAINDTHGHLCGDAVLRRTAQILKSYTSNRIAAGRWGGEEFLVVLKDAKKGEAVQMSERMRSELETADFGEAGTVTASFGVTSAVQGEEMRQIFKRVDDALYAAKRSGRNRVIEY